MSSFVPTSLKSLIRQVRNAKTLAEERAIIAKESASIRTFIKEGTGSASGVSGITAQAAHMLGADLRAMNIQKLLYIHMLGHSAHFGQMECVKLVASPRFSDKRLGYLGVMLLLDENQEVLTLVTNCLKNDLNHQNLFISGLALSTLGNIGSEEMLRDLSSEVEKLLGSSSSYIRKKAALCAVRVLKKLPEMSERYALKCLTLINDKNHGVIITSLSVLIEVATVNPAQFVPELIPQLPIALRLMRNLITAGYSPEHDVTGITDPFLQCKVLSFFRILGKHSKSAADQIHDILAQVATKTDASRNVGNAILYETARTILDIQSDQSLRVLGINILGKFLANKDNNFKYVALQTLSKCVDLDMKAVQRHRTIIVDCLKDPDTSIRRRALDLSFTLCNPSNIRPLMSDLVLFLSVADDEFKQYIVTKVFQVTEKHCPNREWHIQTLIQVLKLANYHVNQEHVSLFIKLISNLPEMQQFTTTALIKELANSDSISNMAITQVGAWCIGEYCTNDKPINKLIELLEYQDRACKPDGRLGGAVEPYYGSTTIASEDKIVNANACKLYLITGLFKLAKHSANKQRIKDTLLKYTQDMHTDVQQRAIEYSQLLEIGQLGEVLVVIPPLEYTVPAVTQVLEQDEELSPISNTATLLNSLIGQQEQVAQKVNNLDQLFDLEPQKETGTVEVYNKGGIKVDLKTTSVSNEAHSLQMIITNHGVYSGLGQLTTLIAVPKSMKLNIQPLNKQELGINQIGTQGFTVSTNVHQNVNLGRGVEIEDKSDIYGWRGRCGTLVYTWILINCVFLKF